MPSTFRRDVVVGLVQLHQFVAVNDIAETILTEEEEKIKQQEQDKTDSGISADMRLGNIVIEKAKANSFLEQKVGGYYKCSWR